MKEQDMATSTGKQLAQGIRRKIEELRKLCEGLDESTASRAPAGFADPHFTPSHQLKHQPVSGFNRSQDDLIHHFLFENGPADESRRSIELFEHRSVTRVS